MTFGRPSPPARPGEILLFTGPRVSVDDLIAKLPLIAIFSSTASFESPAK